MGLDGEAVTYRRCEKDPRLLMKERGVSEDERNHLVSAKTGKTTWSGRRVESNEPTNDQLLGFIERKLTEAGVSKVIPTERIWPTASPNGGAGRWSRRS